MSEDGKPLSDQEEEGAADSTIGLNYRLRKEGLQKRMAKFGLPNEGRVADLRQQLVQFVRRGARSPHHSRLRQPNRCELAILRAHRVT